MLDYLKSSLFYILPHHLISWLVFHLARVRVVPVKNLLLFIYMSLHKVNMSEAVQTDPYAFDTLNAFFTRALKKDARPLAPGERVLLCPVDGAVSQAQPIKNGRVFQAKGRDYSLLELVGGCEHLANSFQNGKSATLYLSPRDYHRIHMPMAAKLSEMVYVPGRLFSVAPHTVNTVPRLFARNERLVCAFDTAAGPMIMVLVGAMNVSAIDTVWSGTVTPPSRHRIVHTEYHNDLHIQLDRGAEMGRFNLGSTVILLFPENVELDAAIKVGAPVKMGQAFGRY
jgi:phosphatidylserine decarboxylase